MHASGRVTLPKRKTNEESAFSGDVEEIGAIALQMMV